MAQLKVKPYTKPPKRLRKTPLLTIADMVKKSSKDSIKKSKSVRIVDFTKKRTPKVLEGWTTFRMKTLNTENGHIYQVTVFSPTLKVTPSSKVMVDSQNPLHAFRFEYALAKRGNSFIYRSNGEPPTTTNPRMVPGLDHHLISALRYLIKRTKSSETATTTRRK